MIKTYDPVQATTFWRMETDLREQAARSIRFIQRRICRPEMAEDARRAARLELRHWRKILMTYET